MDKQIVLHSYNGILVSYNKEQSIYACAEMCWYIGLILKYLMLSERNQFQKIIYTIWFPFCDIVENVKLKGQSRSQVARDGGNV